MYKHKSHNDVYSHGDKKDGFKKRIISEEKSLGQGSEEFSKALSQEQPKSRKDEKSAPQDKGLKKVKDNFGRFGAYMK
jgi:hypothetical protein